MKVLVTVKRVIDYHVKVRVRPDQTEVDLNNVKMAANPFCEIAVEEAVRLREAGIASDILVVSLGPESAIEQLRTALAMGADRALLVRSEETLEPLTVARLLAKVVEQEQIDLVLMGKQSIDTDNNQVGQMLAGLTGMSQGTFASRVEKDGDELQVTREVDGGLQTLALMLPAVVTVDLRLNEPRYASLPNIMKAKKKPLETRTPEDYGIEPKAHCRLLKVAPPPVRQAGVRVADVAELVDKLKHEAKVI